jgi:hypothetical protein
MASPLGAPTWVSPSRRPEPQYVELLYTTTLSFYGMTAKGNQILQLENRRRFNEQLGRLYLWGESFGAGKLGKIFEKYHQLGLTIARLLVKIAINLYECKNFILLFLFLLTL